MAITTALPDRPLSLEAFLSIGFRPFYLAGALYAAISVPLWIAYLLDLVEPNGPLDGLLWHAHELIFGFGVAILVGFLFTAVRNWTGKPTPHGAWLAALLLLWAAGRLALIFGQGLWSSLVDLVFLPLAALGIAVPLVKSNNRRNYFTVFFMLLLTCANGMFHSIAQGWVEVEARTVFLFCIDIFSIFITVIAGRIVPMFTNNALGRPVAGKLPSLEWVLLGGMLILLASDIVFGATDDWAVPRGLFLLALTVLHGVKIALWRPWHTFGNPMLWILPVAYSWVPIGLALRGFSLLDGSVDLVLSLHALTAGAMGSMMLGMMTRSALGHTGRGIKASWVEWVMFVAVTLGAILRVFGPVVLPQFYFVELALSSVLWAIAFGLFFLRYLPYMVRERF